MIEMHRFKKTFLCALALCVLISLPAALSYADEAIPEQTGADEGTRTVLLGEGETYLYDDQDQTIGVLKKDPDSGTLEFSADGKKDWVSASVDYTIPSEKPFSWLRQSSAPQDNPVYLCPVAVMTGAGNVTNVKKGWIGIDRIENFNEIKQSIFSALLSIQADLAAKETELPQATPALTIDPSTIQSPKQETAVQGQPYLDYAMAFVLFVDTITIFAILATVRKLKAQNEKTEKLIKTERGARREAEEKQALTKIDAGDVRESISGVAQSVAAQNAKLEELHTMILKIDARIPPLVKRVEDWEQLLDVANASLHETYYENWGLAFRAKGWEPQALQPIEQGINGVYELAAFGKSQYVAVFASPDRAKQGTVYAIPSCEDRDLRSPQVRDLFNMKSGTPGNFGVYEILKPAVLFSDNNRHFRVITKGEIVVFSL